MAASDTRSSPTWAALEDRLRRLSSSGSSLPEIQDLFAKKPKPQTLRSGSAAAPIPTNVATTFTSASDMLRLARTNGDDSLDAIDEPEPPVAKETPAKRVRKAPAKKKGDDAMDTIDEPEPPVAKKAPAKRARKAPAKKKGDDSLDTVDEPGTPVAKKAPAKRARKTTAKAPNANPVPKQQAKEVIVLSSDGVTPRGIRHEDSNPPEAGVQDEEAAGGKDTAGTPLKSKPWKKFKTPADPGQDDTGELTEAVEQAKAPAKAKAQKKKKPETVSRHFSKESSTSEKPTAKEQPKAKGKSTASEKGPRISTPEPMNLEPAGQRRMDWTPPKPDTSFPEVNMLDESVEMLTQAAEDTGMDASEVFKKLRDSYGHKAADEDRSATPKQQPAQVLGKRKAIEMVAVHQASNLKETSRIPSPAKEKAPKKAPKKLRTITEVALAAYAPQMESEGELHKDDSLLDYFCADGAEQDASKPAVGKGKGKGTKVTKSKRKAPPKKPVLLSPKTAIKQSAAQNFVFGTSSQLAREQSPTFLRDLHEAMKASTIMEEDDDPFATPPVGERQVVRKPSKGKGLWSVSARDEDGKMADSYVIYLADCPTIPEDDAILDPWKQLSPEPAGAGLKTADSSVMELDSRPIPTKEDKTSQPSVPRSHVFMTQRRVTINAVAAASPEHPDTFPLITDLLEEYDMPPPSNQQQTQEEVREPPSTTIAAAPKPKPKSRPKYEQFTDAKLAKEISRYGFKAVKTRTGMLSLLEQCWQSKNQAPVGVAFSTSPLAASPKRKLGASSATDSPPAKKPRGRSKKVIATEAFAQDVAAEATKKRGRPRKDTSAVDQAASSMPPPPRPEPAPSTPKRKKAATQAARVTLDSDLDSEIEADQDLSSPEQLFSPAGADVSINEDTEISLNLSPTAQQSGLYSHITKAITSAPRTTDPENPSWHEKMLMYDPIILEDLTAWLNSGQLTRVGYDGEVAPLDVKKWCESRSVCCLWKGNWHGKERKRF